MIISVISASYSLFVKPGSWCHIDFTAKDRLDSLSTGSNDVYVIAVPGEKDILLPALKLYVKEINIAEKRIVVTLPEWVDEA